jgi:uncharacterized protein (DUF362 family)
MVEATARGPRSELSIGRRDFGLLAAGGLCAATGLASPSFGAASEPPDAPAGSATLARQRFQMGPERPVSVVGVARGVDESVVEDAVRRAALAVTDFSWLSRGDSVLIKPVCNSGNEYPATTDPIALRSMISLLREHGAQRIMVADMSGVQAVRFGPDHLSGSTRQLMTQNRMAQTIESAGAEVHAFEEHGWDAFHDEEPRSSKYWSEPVMMPNLTQEADHIVLMPRCARHMLAGSTLGLKAAVGWWRHDSRLVYHRGGKTLPLTTAEANTVPSLMDKQRLVLTSARKVMTTFGPDNGHVVEPETGLIIASSDVVAHDMVSLSWLLQQRNETPAGARDGFMDDTHTTDFVRAKANPGGSNWLGGLGDAIATTAPPCSEATTIWDDRVLAGAFEAFGGVPQVELVDPEHSLPAPLSSALQQSLAS